MERGRDARTRAWRNELDLPHYRSVRFGQHCHARGACEDSSRHQDSVRNRFELRSTNTTIENTLIL